MEINRLCKELDDAKSEIERLQDELKRKNELCGSLKKANEEKLVQLNDASLRLERQAAEIFEKSEEICEVKQNCDSLRLNLSEKEGTLRHLASVNEKLKAECAERNQKWEDEKKGILLALDEVTELNEVQGINIRSLKEENEALEKVLTASKKKCLEMENKITSRSNIAEGFDVIEKQKIKLEDQLKWKKEQFKHLEEAHDKLRIEFKDSKKEWEREISTLIDKVCLLEENLYLQSRVAEDRQKHLQICNEALAQEESRRKYLQVELSEFKSRFENVFSEFESTKSQLEYVSSKRDNEIAALRSSLSEKDLQFRECHYLSRKLEHENQDLLQSIKELQEAQIKGINSFQRRRLKNVERMQKSSFVDYNKLQEDEINSRLDAQTKELERYKSASECNETIIKKLEMELETCYGALLDMKMQNEESALMLLVIQSGTLSVGNTESSQLDVDNSRLDGHAMELERYKSASECKEHIIKNLEMELEKCNCGLLDMKMQNEESALMLLVIQSGMQEIVERSENSQTDDDNEYRLKDALNRCKEELEESFEKQQFLRENLRKACDSLDAANFNFDEERKKTESLTEEFKEMQDRMQNEIEACRERCKELSICQLQLEEHASMNEKESKKNNDKLCEKLGELNEQLLSAIWDRSVDRFELWLWKFIAERLNMELEHSKDLFKELEASLIAQIEVGESFRLSKDDLDTQLEVAKNEAFELRRKMASFENEVAAAASMKLQLASFESERKEFLLMVQKRDNIIEGLRKEVETRDEELVTREVEGWILTGMLKERTSNHEESLIKIVKEKERKISDLSLVLASLEEQYYSCLISYSQEIALKESELSMTQELCANIVTSVTLAHLEIEEKNSIIAELEDKVHSMHSKLLSGEEATWQLLDNWEASQLKLLELADMLSEKLITSKLLVDETRIAVQKSSAERGTLMNFLAEIGCKMDELSDEDGQLQLDLLKLAQMLENNGEIVDDGKENDAPRPSLHKAFEVIVEERVPFRELLQL